VEAKGRLGKVSNGCFLAIQSPEFGFGRLAALEKRDWQKWVAWRPSALQIHRPKAVIEFRYPKEAVRHCVKATPSRHSKPCTQCLQEFYELPFNLKQSRPLEISRSALALGQAKS